MSDETNLSYLLKNINPILHDDDFIFISVKEEELSYFQRLKPILIFQEKEGITIIISQNIADKNKLIYDSAFKMITLTVNSSLNAVGFLAHISSKFAEAEIPVNVVSAFSTGINK